MKVTKCDKCGAEIKESIPVLQLKTETFLVQFHVLPLDDQQYLKCQFPDLCPSCLGMIVREAVAKL